VPLVADDEVALLRAARSSCRRASYPGDGVTVGGAAWACDSHAAVNVATSARVRRGGFIGSSDAKRAARKPPVEDYSISPPFQGG
jgi:hypothetical protein